LASQSFVETSFNSPLNTANITGLGTLRILESIKSIDPKIKFYQASSSEMFGDILEDRQDEKTPLNPKSPYAISKVFGHYITKNYREAYNIFAVSGILFNHESPLRGEEYITRKIILGLVKILKNDLKCLEIGNIYVKRDWGFAKEYVEAMWLMLQQKKPEDFVIATGKTYSIKEFINRAVRILNLKTKWVGKGLNEKLINIKNKKIIIKINPKFFRPSEVNIIRGDQSKAKKKLKWTPKTNLNDLIKIMIKDEIKFYKKS
jgi:GDPmannose 4,6-dehydratase